MAFSKYTKELCDEICKYVRAGNSGRDSAILSGISEDTYWEWRKPTSPYYKSEYSEAIKKAEQECKARNIAYIQQAGEKQWQASAWYLERKYNNEYALKQIQEIGGIMGEDGKRQEIGLSINLGQGFVPATIAIPTSPNGSVATKPAKVQGSDMASKSQKDVHSTNGADKTSTS